MKLIVVAVGHKMPAWINAGFEEYAKRMPREARVELIEIKPEKRGSAKSLNQVLAAERDRIAAAIPHSCRKVVLDERGKNLTSAQLAQAIEEWRRSGRDVAFVIGGADGLHPDIKQAAERLVSLSALTLPHGLARVILAEQLYRAVSLINHHPYHRE